MKILIPKPTADARNPQWWVMSFNWYKRSGIGHSIDLLVRARWFSIQIRCNCPVDNLTAVKFVRPSRFTDIYICHPNGGGARKLKCEECGAEYPFPTGPLAYPCSFCAVERESKIVVWWERRQFQGTDIGSPLYKKSWQYPKPPSKQAEQAEQAE
jgi:hypothetical protein